VTDTRDDILAGIEDGSIGDRLFTPLTDAEVDVLVETSKMDAGAPFESEAIARLAAKKREDLPGFMRARARLKDAKIKVVDLDKVLAAFGAADEGGGQGQAIKFPGIEPWPKPVDAATLLDEIVAQIERYVVLPHEAACAVALWILHAYCFDVFNISARLVIASPEKRCGKTTLLRLIEALVPKPLAAANITPAAMFRTIEKHRPTLLIDEADTFLPENEELRGIINSGHERRGQVIRLVGDDHEPSAFSTFCPTVIAAIGSVPGTIEDRAVMIALRRRLRGEAVEGFRIDRADHLDELKQRAARWAADHARALGHADPDMPEALHDRAQDNWRPLLAIADLARWDWPQRARWAAQALSAQTGDQAEQSRGVLLLTDIRQVFDNQAKAGGKDAGRISSTDLVFTLTGLPDCPWATWSRGKPITPASVARLLKTFRIVPNTIKLANGKQPNGYKRSQFDDAFARYLGPSSSSAASSSPSSPIPSASGVSERSQSSPQASGGEVSKPSHPPAKQGAGEGGELSNPNRRLPCGDDRQADLPPEFLPPLMERAHNIEVEA
jgi:putative DNA primase/helicase